MASYNRVILLGNLTRDIDIKYTPSGMAIGSTGIAVNDRRKNASGEWVDEPTFVDLTFFGRTAEIAGEYLSKGAPIHIEGRLKLDTWEKDGQKRSRLQVIVERMQMIGGRQSDGNGPRSRPATTAPSSTENYSDSHAMASSDSGYHGGDSFDSSNIPF